MHNYCIATLQSWTMYPPQNVKFQKNIHTFPTEAHPPTPDKIPVLLLKSLTFMTPLPARETFWNHTIVEHKLDF